MKGINNLKITNPSEGVYFKTKKPKKRITKLIAETMERINTDISEAGMIADELKGFYWFNARIFMRPIRNKIIDYNCRAKVRQKRLVWGAINEAIIRKIGGWKLKNK